MKKYIFITLFIAFSITETRASTYLDLEDSYTYGILSRLEAESVIQTGLLDTKPISRKEAYRLLREAEANSGTRSRFIKDLVRSLSDRLGPHPAGMQIKPLDSVYAKYVYTNAQLHTFQYGPARENEQPLNYNNNGDLYKRGSNERIGFTSRLEDWGPLSIAFNPEFRYPDTPFTEQDLVTRKAYAVFDLGWDIVLGRDSQWWGPGYHGSLLLSNHAEPLTMLKLANPSPVRLPWIFDSLGPFGFTFFVTNLEKARKVPEPYLWGMRLGLKPHPNLEIGLERTALLGGHGRPEDIGIWAKSIFGANDADNCWEDCYREPGDQRAGLSFKLTIPWEAQPLQIYLQATGEDEYNNLPNLWAFIGGIYLPKIAGADQFDLRLEAATTRGRHNSPYTWYKHHIFESYTYKGNIIGHHIGTAANDWFIELSYLAPEKNTRVSLSYNRQEHNVYVEGSNQTLDDITVGLTTSLTKHVDLETGYSYGRLRNQGNTPHNAINLSAFEMQLKYRF